MESSSFHRLAWVLKREAIVMLTARGDDRAPASPLRRWLAEQSHRSIAQLVYKLTSTPELRAWASRHRE